MDEGFIKIPRSFLRDPLWRDLTPTYKCIFLTLLELAVYKPTKFDDAGNIVDLTPGQVCISIRQLAKLCGHGISKNDIERALTKFLKYEFVRQEVRHFKSVITICFLESYEQEKNQSETGKETSLRQFRDSFETQKKKDKKERKKEIEKDITREDLDSKKILTLPEISSKLDELSANLAPETTQHNMYYPDSECETHAIASNLKSYQTFKISITEQEHEKLVEAHGEDLLAEAYAILDQWKSTKDKKIISKHSDYGRLTHWVITAARKKRVEERELKIREKRASEQEAGKSTQWGTPTIDRRTKNQDGTIDDQKYKDLF